LIAGRASLTEGGYRLRLVAAILAATLNSKQEEGLSQEALKNADAALDRRLTDGAYEICVVSELA
jgi:hypothetical protein